MHSEHTKQSLWCCSCAFCTGYIWRPGWTCWEDEIFINESWMCFSRWALTVLMNLHSLKSPFYILHYIYWSKCSQMNRKCLKRLTAYIADCPAALVSSEGASVPIEASIEDLHHIEDQPCIDSIQSDARLVYTPPALDEKLNREMQYHKHGSYNCDNQSDAANHYGNSNPFLRCSDHIVKQPEEERPLCVSSVHSFTKVEPVQPTSQEETFYRSPAGRYESMNSSVHTSNLFPVSVSSPSLPFNQQHPHSHYDRQQSWPAYPVSDTSAPDMTPSKYNSLQDSGKGWRISLADCVCIESRCLRLSLSDMYLTVCVFCACSRISLHSERQWDPDWEQQHDAYQRLWALQ